MLKAVPRAAKLLEEGRNKPGSMDSTPNEAQLRLQYRQYKQGELKFKMSLCEYKLD